MWSCPDGGVGWRCTPGSRTPPQSRLAVGEPEQCDEARPVTLQDAGRKVLDQDLGAVRLQGLIDSAQVLHDLRTNGQVFRAHQDVAREWRWT